MSFAAPAGLLLALLAVPIVLLHVLRPRREPLPVSSTWLWEELSRPVTAASPWQRLRPSVLLLLQLLAVALLALAAARPVRATDAPLAPHTVFVIDASGSMAARDGEPERLDEAKDDARRLRSQLPAGGVASIVVADADPHVALSTSADRRAFDDALRSVRTVAAPARFDDAFSLAASLETPGLPLGVVLVSDGALDAEARRALRAGTRFVPVGDRSANRAITRLVVEPEGAGLRALVVLRNTGGPAATETVRVDVDGRTEARFSVDLPRGATVERAVSVPDGERVEAFLEADDLLLADNRAFALAARRPPVRVLHVGPGNPFLDRLWAALPGVTVERSATARPATGFDLAVYDRVAVPSPLEAPALVIAPPGGLAEVAVTGTVEGPAIALVDGDDPLLRGIDLSGVLVLEAQRIKAPRDQTLVAAEGAPLLVRGVRDGRAFLYLAFALDASDLPLQVAFPVLGDRLVTELAGTSVPAGDVRVGQPLSVGPGATVTLPTGAREPASSAGVVVTRMPGFHTVAQPGRAERLVAVNVDPAESSVAPERSLPIPAPAAGSVAVATRGERSLLPFVVLALVVVLAAELLVSRRQIGVPRRQWRAGLGVRLALVLALVGALLDIAVPRPGSGVATMFLIDASDSMGGAGRSAATTWVQQALAAQPDGARAGVAFFGGDARLELTVQRDPQLVQPATTVDAARTDLAGALRLAAAVLPSDARRRIVIVSDGRATQGDAGAEADRLRDEGIRVDVHPVARTTARDAAIASVQAPARAAQGEIITLQATVIATDPGSARVVVDVDGQPVAERAVDLQAGANVVAFDHPVTASGVRRYRVRVELAGDAITQNDAGFAAVEVDGPPRVLVAEGVAGAGATLASALRAAGLAVDVTGAGDLPPVEQLAGYQSTVLVDVDARDLSAPQTEGLTTATRDLGRGLVTVGGERAYALGGYRDSALEALLPVISDVTDPKRRSSVAEVLALDTSGSMGACHCAEGSNGMVTGGNRANGGVNKTDIAKAGATRAIAALSSTDQVGVLAFNRDQKMVLPMQVAPDADDVRDRLAPIRADGETDVVAGLRRAAKEVRATNAKLRHVILFTDGFTAPGALTQLEGEAAALLDEGITVSVVATGEGAATELARVAEAGGGRFYAGRDLNEIPEILVQEAVLASRSFVNEGEFFPTVARSTAATAGLQASPPLFGFIATTAKPSASTALRIGDDDDPLLATWNTGLGRVSSWTSDATSRWSQAWATWDGFAAFWSAVVRDTFPTTTEGLVARAAIDGDRLRLTVESKDPIAEGAQVTGRVTTPGAGTATVTLERTSATTFAVDLPAPSAGAYTAGVTVDVAGEVSDLTALATQSYAAEYRPGATDAAALLDVSRRSGGRGAIDPDDAFAEATLTEGRGRFPLAGGLLLLAALLWPIDVALRRLTLRPELVRSVGQRVPRPRIPAWPGTWARRRRVPTPEPTRTPAPPPPLPSSPALQRLLERKRRAEEPEAPVGDRPPPAGE